MYNANGLMRIDAHLLAYLMDKVSEFGSTGDGGVHRLVLSDEHIAARKWFREELRARDYDVLVDDIGNLFGKIELAGPDAPLIMVGSHLDSQPRGGRFDGAYGVIAGLAAIETWRRKAIEAGIVPTCNYVVADWMNEEGARFQPSLLGSSVYTGAIARDFALGRTDGAGVTVGAELVRTSYMGTDPAPKPDCYIELHIEGDRKMEDAGARIAPFVRHWGAVKLRIAVTGEQNHTGPTPMQDRHDAMLGAAYIIAKVRELADTANETLYTSVARVEISPNSPNVIPGRVVLFVELRSPEAEMLNWSERALTAALPELAAKASVATSTMSVERRRAGKFDTRLIALCERTAQDFGLKQMRLDTIAGHDGVALNAILPSIVIAVPSVNGAIHCNDEFTSIEDLAAGGDVLVEMIRRIDRAGGSLDRAGGSP